MNLPHHFLADLPPEATLSASMIAEACRTLRRNRAHHLARLSTEAMASVLAETARYWRQPEYPFRQMALESSPSLTGFPASLLARGLDSFFGALTYESLHALLVQDLGMAQRLDQFCATEFEQRRRESALATAPELLVQITAGNMPVSAMTSLVLGLLIRSPQFIKCGSGASLLPRLLAHSLVEMEPGIAACLEIAEWPGGTGAGLPLEEILFAEADCVTATGSDESLAAIRRRVPPGTRFIGYGNRVSFGYVTRDVLGGFAVREVVAQAVEDVVAWNQLGCLSPHAFYVESGGAMSAEHFAERLADGLREREEELPRGAVSVEESAVIALKRDFYRVRAAASPGTRLWHSEGSTAWTVVFEGDPQFQVSCLNRFVYVKPVASLEETLHFAELMRGRVSTVGLAAPGQRAGELALQLARWGVTRVCPLGRMQQPPLTWRHDGRPALGDLVTWTGWEQ